MTARKALVVDDSRSARAFLTRILERYELSVDGVESAEQAIEYLTRQRPDVIFMDHLMPGMDGFQAVQAISRLIKECTVCGLTRAVEKDIDTAAESLRDAVRPRSAGRPARNRPSLRRR